MPGRQFMDDVPEDESPPRAARTAISKFSHFVSSGGAGGIALIVSSLIALVWANSPWSESYFALLETELGVSLGGHNYSLTLHHWVNDGLMVLFFLNIGLEIKREILVGALATWRKALLPLTAALGGMLVPALIYVGLNAGTDASSGWGIPIATDIAFALGILALLGRRIPVGLKIFMTAFAVADDMGAVLIIALFYSESISLLPLVGAAGFLALMMLLSYLNISRTEIYVILGVMVWLSILMAGVHGTVAGVLIALVVPATIRVQPEHYVAHQRALIAELGDVDITRESILTDKDQLEIIAQLRRMSQALEPPLSYIEHYLSPVVNIVVLPLFALFNAGVTIGSDLVGIVQTPVSLGIICGLVFGKQIGIMLATWLIVRFGPARMPENVHWRHVYGVTWLAGIGFTMSLFITDLAFGNEAVVQQAKIGILVASVLAGTVGLILLFVASRGRESSSKPQPA